MVVEVVFLEVVGGSSGEWRGGDLLRWWVVDNGDGWWVVVVNSVEKWWFMGVKVGGCGGERDLATNDINLFKV